jgi:asparagine synthase (glutamine-hydrolysing)
MCGICGYTRLGTTTDASVIEGMKDAMTHRGPDDHGTYADEGVVMGHRRLSIIDLKTGLQPMGNETNTIVAVCNGEIYNYKALRKALVKKGHRFRTKSDTEVLVHLYEEYGESFVQHLIGMFAFAIWDAERKSLFMARDRYGQKPLYYAERNGQLIFSSSLQALVLYPGVEKRIDKEALSQYLAYEYIPAPYAIYKGVRKISAGSCLKWKTGRTRLWHYWDYPVGSPVFHGTIDDCTRELRRLLNQSVKLRLVSDVPLGVFLSGGIDSSAVVALMSHFVSPDRIKTFSIGFRERDFDETPYAHLVADYFGTDHRVEILDASKLFDLLPDVIDAYDEPFADASAIPTYALSRFTRKHVTVALGGDGGDELFAGYDPFVAHRIAKILKPIQNNITKKFLLKVAESLPPSDRNLSFEFRLKRFIRHLNGDPVSTTRLWLGAFNWSLQQDLLTPPFLKGLSDPFKQSSNGRKRPLHFVDAVAYEYVKNYLQEDILTKVDRASMAHALEVRAPFLDHKLGEFVSTIPVKWKLRGLTTKYILKRALRPSLPHTILKRKKRGFGIPKAKWLREDLRPLVEDLFSQQSITQGNIFSFPFVDQMMKEHFRRKKDHQKELWTLLIFEMWRKRTGAAA